MNLLPVLDMFSLRFMFSSDFYSICFPVSLSLDALLTPLPPRSPLTMRDIGLKVNSKALRSGRRAPSLVISISPPRLMGSGGGNICLFSSSTPPC